MSKYDDEYFILDRPKRSPQYPALVPDDNIADWNFRFEALPLGTPPLVFRNGWKDRRAEDGVKEVAADVLLEGSNLVVRSGIREALLNMDIPDLHMHPSIFIDGKNKWHEDYWYLCFTNKLDCWDRDRSEYEEEPLEMGGFKLYSVHSYSLDEEVLNAVPLERRRLFKMGGTQDGYVICHQSLAHLFRKPGSGVDLIAISSY